MKSDIKGYNNANDNTCEEGLCGESCARGITWEACGEDWTTTAFVVDGRGGLFGDLGNKPGCEDN